MSISPQCYLVVVLGAKGGVGKTHVAANLAASLAGELKKPVLLIDGDQHTAGDLNVILGLKPVKTLTELAQFQGSLTSTPLQQLVTPHKTGIHYVGAVRSLDESLQAPSSSVSKVIEYFSSHYPVIIVDIGNELSDLQSYFLSEATLGLIVTSNDLLVLNQTQKLLARLLKMTLPLDMFRLVMNKTINAGVQPAVVAKNMKVELLSVLGNDEEGHLQAVQSGLPYVAVKSQSPIAQAYVELARKLSSGLLAKLKSQARPKVQLVQASAAGATPGTGTSGGAPSVTPGQPTEARNILKMRIHNELIKAMDLKKGVTDTNGDPEKERQLREKTLAQITQIVDREAPSVARDERSKLIKEVLEEALGLGPLEDLLADPTVTEIMVNGYNKIFIEKGGKIQLSPVTFTSNMHLRNVIERIVTPLGRRIDEKTPMVDARLKDGSRVNAVIEPLAIDGPALTIRKFKKGGISPEQYVQFGTLTRPMIEFLKICVENGLNIVISGGTGSGKTSLLNMLSSFIPANERIVTVEDAAELQLQQEHVVRLETRPPNMEGTGAVTIRDLIRNALRMRPDRIIVGETRDGAALDMLQAMNTGHDGSMTTTHANSPRECIARLETLSMMAGMELPVRAIREQIASAVHLIVQISRLSDGSRKVMSITEVVGMQGEVVSLQEIFRFKETGYDKNRRIIGEFQALGMIPSFVEKFEQKGVVVPREIFSNLQGDPSSSDSSKNVSAVKNPIQMPKIKLTGT